MSPNMEIATFLWILMMMYALHLHAWSHITLTYDIISFLQEKEGLHKCINTSYQFNDFTELHVPRLLCLCDII